MNVQKSIKDFRINVKKYKEFSIKYDYIGQPPKFFKRSVVWLFNPKTRSEWDDYISFTKIIKQILQLQPGLVVFSNEDYINGNIYVITNQGFIHWAVPNEFKAVIKLINENKPIWAEQLGINNA